MIRLAAASSPPPSISQSNHAGIGVVLDGECCVASISKGGAARINGGIHVGDTVWSVDGAEFPSGTDPGKPTCHAQGSSSLHSSLYQCAK